MKESARVQSAIEILENVFLFKQPADNTINVYFRTHRYIGSKDRKVIAELVWKTLRSYGRWSSLSQNVLSARQAVLTTLFYEKQEIETLFDDEKYAPSFLTSQEKDFLASLPENPPSKTLECPLWLREEISEQEIIAMTEEACLDLRVNTLKASRQDVLALFEQEGIEAKKTPFSPIGIRIKTRVNLATFDAFKDGLIEIQDEGSQIVSLLTQAQENQTIIDWCAGAGGKTLALSAMMKATGTLYAVDINMKRARDLPERAFKADAKNVILLNDYKSIKQKFDLVLVDAPCTGSGTWRRSPDARWRVTQEESEALIKTQKEILNKACKSVKKGGRLFYITCSLDKRENEEQVTAFLQENPSFEQENLAPVFEQITGQKIKTKSVSLYPSVYQTDGFFAVSFRAYAD